MNLTGWPVSLLFAVLLVSCAGVALYQTWGFMFAKGEAEAAVGLGVVAVLFVTLLGAAGLVIGALGSWSRWPIYSKIPLVSALCVLPAAVLFCWQQGGAYWRNTQIGVFHYGPLAWASVLLPLPLDLAAVLLSGLRFRQLKRSTP
ncbi:MAG: hypothetical protein ACLPH3_24730 [Terracidiphilus sp.]